LNDTANATEITNVTVVTNNPQDILSISITLEMRVADLVLLTPAPHDQITAGTKSVVTTFLKYTPLVDKVNGGNLAATGTMTLKDITNPKSPVSLTSGYLNSGCDPSNDPNCPNEPPNTVILPAVILSAGVHTLQVSYNGDSYYSPNTSNIFQVDVGQPVLSLATVPANLALIVQGKTTATPSTEDVTFDSHYTLGVPSPQAGAVGVRYLFNHWADTGDTNAARTVSINGNTNSYTAAFDTQYLVNLVAIPAGGGTVTSTDEPADGYYPSDAKETITATPNPGYYFTGYTGALTNNQNNQLFNVAPNATIRGNFAPTTAPRANLLWNGSRRTPVERQRQCVGKVCLQSGQGHRAAAGTRLCTLGHIYPHQPGLFGRHQNSHHQCCRQGRADPRLQRGDVRFLVHEPDLCCPQHHECLHQSDQEYSADLRNDRHHQRNRIAYDPEPRRLRHDDCGNKLPAVRGSQGIAGNAETDGHFVCRAYLLLDGGFSALAFHLLDVEHPPQTAPKARRQVRRLWGHSFFTVFNGFVPLSVSYRNGSAAETR